MKFISPILFAFLLIITSCDEDIEDLPTSVTIKILSIDLPSRTVSLVSTQPTSGIKGEWSIVSQNQIAGTFSDISDPLANFVGDVFESYTIRWTLSNGKDEMFSEQEFIIGDGYTIKELLDAAVSLCELVEYFPLPDLVNYGFAASDLQNCGVDLPELVQAGVHAEELLAMGFSPYELYQNGASLNEIIVAHRPHYITLLDAGVPVIELSEAGILVGEFNSYGKTDRELEAAGMIGSLADIDGNFYRWVKIGKQTWMSENLKTTKYASGEALNVGDYADAPHDFGKMYSIYGTLHGDVSATNPSGVQGVCPANWHVPSIAEWLELRNVLGTESALKIKSEEGGYWEVWSNDTKGNNLSGLSVLPAGVGSHRFINIGLGPIENYVVGQQALFWAADPLEKYGDRQVAAGMRFDFNFYDFFAQVGFDDRYFTCVRCVKNK